MTWWTELTGPQAAVLCTLLVCFLRAEIGVAVKQRAWKVDE
ncbi:hypothetical protein [Luteitalea sp.]|nr:hypothetical protein [Luteitalea sp.]